MKKYDFHTPQSFSTAIIALPLYLLLGCQVLNCILHSGQNLDIYKHIRPNSNKISLWKWKSFPYLQATNLQETFIKTNKQAKILLYYST